MIKNSYRTLFILLLTICAVNVKAQSEEDGAKTIINQLFDAMRHTDTSLLRSVFARDAILQTVIEKPGGGVTVMTEPLDSFFAAIGRPHTEQYDERISFESVKIDGKLASVYTPYKFYVGETFSHCGVDVFQLVKYP